MIYNFFDKKASGGDATLARSITLARRNRSAVTNENMSKKELAEELHKLIIRKFEKIKVHSPFIDNIWGGNLAHLQLISKSNKGIPFLLCAIDIFSKYVWVIPLKDKKRYYNYQLFSKNFKRIYSQTKQNMDR